jgi:SagB-type dehydrogenase family enzyme
MLDGPNPQPRKRINKEKEFFYNIGDEIRLPKTQMKMSADFFQVLSNRRSRRAFSLISIDQISEFLWQIGKVHRTRVEPNGQILSYRQSPSAGAIHPFDILISLPEQLANRNFYLYNAIEHKLNLINSERILLNNFFNLIHECIAIDNGTLIWLAGRASATNAKYKNYQSLFWRDSGALLMTAHLVASALKMNSCLVGTLGNPYLRNIIGNESSLYSGGGLVLG